MHRCRRWMMPIWRNWKLHYRVFSRKAKHFILKQRCYFLPFSRDLFME